MSGPGLVALVHTKGGLPLPTRPGFRVLQRLPSADFGMGKSYEGKEVSEFEIVVLQRVCASSEDSSEDS